MAKKRKNCNAGKRVLRGRVIPSPKVDPNHSSDTTIIVSRASSPVSQSPVCHTPILQTPKSHSSALQSPARPSSIPPPLSQPPITTTIDLNSSTPLYSPKHQNSRMKHSQLVSSQVTPITSRSTPQKSNLSLIRSQLFEQTPPPSSATFGVSPPVDQSNQSKASHLIVPGLLDTSVGSHRSELVSARSSSPHNTPKPPNSSLQKQTSSPRNNSFSLRLANQLRGLKRSSSPFTKTTNKRQKKKYSKDQILEVILT